MMILTGRRSQTGFDPRWQLFENGLIRTGPANYSQVIKVEPINLELLAPDQIRAYLARFEDFLNSQTQTIQIISQSRPLKADDYLNRLGGQIGAGQAGNWNNYCRLIRSLSLAGNIINRNFYVVVGGRLGQTDIRLAAGKLNHQAAAVLAGLNQIGLKANFCQNQQLLELVADSYGYPADISPKASLAVTETADCLKIDNGLNRSFGLISWPVQASFGYLNRLINWPAHFDISYHLQPVDSSLAQICLRRKISETESRRRLLVKKGQLIGAEVLDPLESARQLRDQIQRGQQKLFLMAVYINLKASSRAGLDRAGQQLKSLLAGRLFESRLLKYQQLAGFYSCLPLNINYLGNWRNLDSGCAALTWPFVGSALTKPRAILYGLNRINNSPVLLDRFQLTNANSLIFAKSGAGKSYAAKVEIVRQLLLQTAVTVIDPENEYRDLARANGGRVIDCRLNHDCRLNLWQRQLWWPRTKDDNQSPTGNYLDDLATILSLFLGHQRPAEHQALEKALNDLFLNHRSRPDLAGLISRLQQTGQAHLADSLRNLAGGPLAGLLQSQADSLQQLNQSRLTVFCLESWPGRYRAGLSLLIGSYLRALSRLEVKKRLLVIDEAWSLLTDPRSAAFLAELVRRARKHYLGVCLISQSAADFLNNPAGQTIAAQAASKLILQTDSSCLPQLTRAFGLSPTEADFLVTASVGQGLLLADNQRVTVKIIASKTEDSLIRTDPQRRLKPSTSI